MKIFPAIDIRDKKVVRLTFGDYDQMKIYADDPLQIAKNFCDCGSKNLHVVDLDGAKDGNLANFDVIEKIAKNCGMFVQVGGGIRDEQRIKQYIDCGVGRVILGTVAIEKFAFVEQMAKKYGDKIAVGVDAKDGYVAIHGWKTVTDIDSVEFCQKLRDAGVKTVIYTDISKWHLRRHLFSRVQLRAYPFCPIRPQRNPSQQALPSSLHEDRRSF